MNVAIVQESLDASRGGAETSTLEMARALAQCGARVTLIGGGTTLPATDPGGISIQPIGLQGRGKLRRTREFLCQAGQLARSGAFDVVHAVVPIADCDVYQPRGGTYRETIRRTLAIVRNPLWRTIKRASRELNLRQRMLRRAEDTLLRSASPPVVACVSEYVRRHVLTDFPQLESHVRVVFNGVEVAPPTDAERSADRRAIREALGIGDATPLLAFVAHNFRLKGLGELIAAMPRMARCDAHVLVAGRDRAARYERLAASQGVGGRVRFVGTRWPARSIYLSCDALVHATWYDPCSRVVLEALALGLPVVTTRWNGAAEAIASRAKDALAAPTGVVIDSPDDLAALAAGCDTVLDADLSRAARGHADSNRGRFSMGRHARELIALYEEIIRRRSERLNPTPIPGGGTCNPKTKIQNPTS